MSVGTLFEAFIDGVPSFAAGPAVAEGFADGAPTWSAGTLSMEGLADGAPLRATGAIFEERTVAIVAPPPIAPTSLVATVLAPGRVELTWSDNSTDEDGFVVERREASGGIWGNLVTLAENVETYEDESATPLVEYEYRVYAFNDDGDSSPTNVATAETPMPPTLSLTGPPEAEEPPPRNRLEGLTVSFLSAGTYGVERNPDGSISGYKY